MRFIEGLSVSETETFYLGSIADLAVTSGGRRVVADQGAATVKVFRADGRHIDTPGQGERPVPVQRLAGLYNATMGSDVVQDARDWLDPARGGVVGSFVQQTSFGEQWNYAAEPDGDGEASADHRVPALMVQSPTRRAETTASFLARYVEGNNAK